MYEYIFNIDETHINTYGSTGISYMFQIQVVIMGFDGRYFINGVKIQASSGI